MCALFIIPNRGRRQFDVLVPFCLPSEIVDSNLTTRFVDFYNFGTVPGAVLFSILKSLKTPKTHL